MLSIVYAYHIREICRAKLGDDYLGAQPQAKPMNEFKLIQSQARVL